MMAWRRRAAALLFSQQLGLDAPSLRCLLLLAPQRDPVFTHAVPRPPGRSTTLNCRILNSTLKLSSCDDNYDANYVYPLLITGVGRSGTRFAAKTLTATGYDVAHDDARCGRVGASSWPLAIREGVVAPGIVGIFQHPAFPDLLNETPADRKATVRPGLEPMGYRVTQLPGVVEQQQGRALRT